jgi:hypothetical protein
MPVSLPLGVFTGRSTTSACEAILSEAFSHESNDTAFFDETGVFGDTGCFMDFGVFGTTGSSFEFPAFKTGSQSQ